MSDPIGPSRSAMLVAACRMLADNDRPGRRLCHDPYARLFVDDHAVVFARRNPGLARVIQLRTRYIDDAITAFASDHTQAQVVLLGAGNDARALRLDIDARFFEIDMPATLAHKAAVLDSSGVEMTVNRTALPVDLTTSRFVEPLIAAGFDVSASTIVVWEGVTNYLDEPALESTLAQIAEIVRRGGQLVVDYVRVYE